VNTSFGREHEPFWGKKNDIMAWLVCEIVLQLCCAITARASTSAFPTLITEDKDGRSRLFVQSVQNATI